MSPPHLSLVQEAELGDCARWLSQPLVDAFAGRGLAGDDMWRDLQLTLAQGILRWKLLRAQANDPDPADVAASEEEIERLKFAFVYTPAESWEALDIKARGIAKLAALDD